MRVVLDTNVLVSAIFFAGTPARILAGWSDGRFDLLASIDILSEYRRVIVRLSQRFPSVEAQPILDLVLRECRLVEPVPVPATACDDPDDLKFLACAVAGRASCIVSGDRALLRASGFGGHRGPGPAGLPAALPMTGFGSTGSCGTTDWSGEKRSRQADPSPPQPTLDPLPLVSPHRSRRALPRQRDGFFAGHRTREDEPILRADQEAASAG
jgi:putative PIN family toxin of toxin-antitoxin system